MGIFGRIKGIFGRKKEVETPPPAEEPEPFGLPPPRSERALPPRSETGLPPPREPLARRLPPPMEPMAPSRPMPTERADITNLRAKIDLLITEVDSIRTQNQMINEKLKAIEKALADMRGIRYY